MNDFTITFFNEEQKEWIHESVKVYTFAEAARDAFMLRNKMGWDWKIQRIVETTKTKKEVFK